MKMLKEVVCDSLKLRRINAEDLDLIIISLRVVVVIEMKREARRQCAE